MDCNYACKVPWCLAGKLTFRHGHKCLFWRNCWSESCWLLSDNWRNYFEHSAFSTSYPSSSVPITCFRQSKTNAEICTWAVALSMQRRSTFGCLRCNHKGIGYRFCVPVCVRACIRAGVRPCVTACVYAPIVIIMVMLWSTVCYSLGIFSGNVELTI